ncbi:MAG: hypothetical protein GOV15_02335 [Candidatus Diapherotrites archaeon]|nr:hypothetical protein [Candidatus Diapherotrites archaeon]
MRKSDSKRLDDFLDDVTTTLTQGMVTKVLWPGNGIMLFGPSGGFIGSNLYDLFLLAKERGMTAKDFSGLFESPSLAKTILTNNGIISLKYADKFKMRLIDPEQLTEFVLFILDVIYKHPFETVLYKQKFPFEVYDSKVPAELSAADDVTARRAFSNLNATVDAVGRGTFFEVLYQSFVDVFYKRLPKSEGGGTYLVRNAFNLNPKELFPDYSSEFDQVVTLGKFDIGLKFDYFDHPKTKENLFNRITDFAVLTRKKGKTKFNLLYDEHEINEVVDHLGDVAVERTAAVNAMDPIEVQTLCCNIEYYSFRRLFKHFGYDWTPPLDAIATIEAMGHKFWDAGRKKQKLLHGPTVRKVHDPRLHWNESLPKEGLF